MRRLDSDWGADQRSSPGLNWEVIICTTALVCFGTVMVFSATSSMGAGGLGDSANFGEVKRHLMSILLALCAAAVVYRVPMNFWYRHSTWLLPVGLLLLASVFLPVIGKSVNGARRWLQLGPLSIQASEMVKLCALIYAAAFTVKRQEYMHSFSKGFFPMAIVMVIIAFMLMQQPDLGATVVVSVVIMGVLFLGGLSMKIFLAVGTVIVAFVALMIFMTPWRLSRVLAYLDPWSDEYVLGQAYQLSHSLIAFGRGELFGVGLGGSVEKLNYLPEAHTDFIMAVVAEETGLVGVILILFIFTGLFAAHSKSVGRRSSWSAFSRACWRKVWDFGSEFRRLSILA